MNDLFDAVRIGTTTQCWVLAHLVGIFEIDVVFDCLSTGLFKVLRRDLNEIRNCCLPALMNVLLLVARN